MAHFTSQLQTIRPSFPVLDIDPNIDLLSPIFMDNFHTLLGFPYDHPFSHQTPPSPENLAQNFPTIFPPINQNSIPTSSSSGITSPAVSEKGIIKRKNVINKSGRGKRLKVNEKEEEKSKDVVHVRARRGQATDSHSLAERVRRGKINEKLRCLQDIVPGCSKTMGMAVMLDEIINYVQSLQNQVEFLSMKLTAASSFYDFNLEPEAEKILQIQWAQANEGEESERMMYEEYGGIDCIH